MIEKELFIHYSITLKIFPPNFPIIFGCQSVRIEPNILHHFEARKLWITYENLLLDKSSESFSKSVRQNCWHTHRTTMTIGLRCQWNNIIQTLECILLVPQILCLSYFEFVEIIKKSPIDFVSEKVLEKFLNSQFCSTTELHVWICSFILVSHQPLATKKNCSFDGTWLLTIRIAILKNESHCTNHHANAYICMYCNLESSLHASQFVNRSVKVLLLKVHRRVTRSFIILNLLSTLSAFVQIRLCPIPRFLGFGLSKWYAVISVADSSAIPNIGKNISALFLELFSLPLWS